MERNSIIKSSYNILNMRLKKGGNLSAVPVESYGYEYGGSASEDAAGRMLADAEQQNKLNSTLSGGRRMKRGGANSTDVIEIPTFPQVGPQVSGQTANSAAFQVNSILIEAENNAANDSKIGGGTKKRFKSRKTKKNYKHKKGCRCPYCNKMRKLKRMKSLKKHKKKTRGHK